MRLGHTAEPARQAEHTRYSNRLGPSTCPSSAGAHWRGLPRPQSEAEIVSLLRRLPSLSYSLTVGSLIPPSRGTYGESAARPSLSHRHWRAERRPPSPETEVDTIGLRLSARYPPPLAGYAPVEKSCAARQQARLRRPDDRLRRASRSLLSALVTLADIDWS
jgi:hypothetical protein